MWWLGSWLKEDEAKAPEDRDLGLGSLVRQGYDSGRGRLDVIDRLNAQAKTAALRDFAPLSQAVEEFSKAGLRVRLEIGPYQLEYSDHTKVERKIAFQVDCWHFPIRVKCDDNGHALELAWDWPSRFPLKSPNDRNFYFMAPEDRKYAKILKLIATGIGLHKGLHEPRLTRADRVRLGQ